MTSRPTPSLLAANSKISLSHKIPTRRSSSSTTGAPEMPFCDIMVVASHRVLSFLSLITVGVITSFTRVMRAVF